MVRGIAVQDVLVTYCVSCLEAVGLEDDLAHEASRSRSVDPLDHFERVRVTELLNCKFHANSFVLFNLSIVTRRISLMI